MNRLLGIGFLACALVCAGCALDTAETSEGEPATGEAGAALLFSGNWKTTHRMQTRVFDAPIGSTVRVTANANFSEPGCPGTYSAEMIHFPSGEVLGVARAYPRSQAHTESWLSVGGKYQIRFSTTRPPQQCTLMGTVSVDLTKP